MGFLQDIYSILGQLSGRSVCLKEKGVQGQKWKRVKKTPAFLSSKFSFLF